jgi:hypothetical protein
VALAVNLGGYDTFLHMSIFDLVDVCEDLKDIQRSARKGANRLK